MRKLTLAFGLLASSSALAIPPQITLVQPQIVNENYLVTQNVGNAGIYSQASKNPPNAISDTIFAGRLTWPDPYQSPCLASAATPPTVVLTPAALAVCQQNILPKDGSYNNSTMMMLYIADYSTLASTGNLTMSVATTAQFPNLPTKQMVAIVSPGHADVVGSVPYLTVAYPNLGTKVNKISIPQQGTGNPANPTIASMLDPALFVDQSGNSFIVIQCQGQNVIKQTASLAQIQDAICIAPIIGGSIANMNAGTIGGIDPLNNITSGIDWSQGTVPVIGTFTQSEIDSLAPYISTPYLSISSYTATAAVPRVVYSAGTYYLCWDQNINPLTTPTGSQLAIIQHIAPIIETGGQWWVKDPGTGLAIGHPIHTIDPVNSYILQSPLLTDPTQQLVVDAHGTYVDGTGRLILLTSIGGNTNREPSNPISSGDDAMTAHEDTQSQNGATA